MSKLISKTLKDKNLLKLNVSNSHRLPFLFTSTIERKIIDRVPFNESIIVSQKVIKK